MKHRLMVVLLIVLIVFWAVACEDRNIPRRSSPVEATPGGAVGTVSGEELSAFQKEHGIGPVKEPLQLTSLDAALADEGKQLFETKCSACHKLQERYVGPPLGEVLKRRTPEYVMNMMLNPAEMVQKHPTAKGVFAEFLVQMPFQNLTTQESRAILEYLRRTQGG